MPPSEVLSDTLRAEIASTLRAVRGLEALWVGSRRGGGPLALAEIRIGAAERLVRHARGALATLYDDTLPGEAESVVLVSVTEAVVAVDVDDDLTLLALANPAALDEAGVTHLGRLADRIDACRVVGARAGVRGE